MFHVNCQPQSIIVQVLRLLVSELVRLYYSHLIWCSPLDSSDYVSSILSGRKTTYSGLQTS